MASRNQTRDNLRTLARTRAKTKPKTKAKPKPRARTKSLVQTFVPKRPPHVVKYIDIRKIFKHHSFFDAPFVVCHREADDFEFRLVEDPAHLMGHEDLDVSGSDLRASFMELLYGSKTNGREEATFLRALADLIDATVK